MYRNKDKQNKIPLEKKLTKELSKYDRQYKNLDYDTIKDIVDTKNNSFLFIPWAPTHKHVEPKSLPPEEARKHSGKSKKGLTT